MKKLLQKPIVQLTVYMLAVLVVFSIIAPYFMPGPVIEEKPLSQVEDTLSFDTEKIEEITLLTRSNKLEVIFTETNDDGVDGFVTSYPEGYEGKLTENLQSSEHDFEVDEEPPGLWEMFISLLPWIILLGIVIFFFTQIQGQGNRMMQFGKSKAKKFNKDMPKVTFDDVAGLEEAKAELEEIKDFLTSPDRYRQIGAKIPKGVLLFGPPGTGKTLMARAVAGEAGVPFMSISGSEFVEMFVGVGASRVRDLFEKAKEEAPAIIFIDEIDAVGRRRGAGMGGGHDEREQTLNQLLVELDGFAENSGVVVVAATNRPDVLDPALLRPGRFDRQITVDAPDVEGREAILKVHVKGKPLSDEVDLKLLAKRTPGFTGADLANLINEAALLTARQRKQQIDQEELEEAIERVIAGPERKTNVMTDEDKRVIAYHETGHAIVGYAMPRTDPVHKITIVARGRSLGHTLSLPERDKYINRRSELIDRLAMILGGRAAEEVIYADPGTGAGNDIEKATDIARKMVMEVGMSEKLGPVKYGSSGSGNVFLGQDYAQKQPYSDQYAAAIDDEVKRLVSEGLDKARDIVEAHSDAVERMVEVLMEKETVEREEIAGIFHDVPQNSWGQEE